MKKEDFDFEEFKTNPLKDYTKDYLVSVCRALQLKKTGTKKELYERIIKYYMPDAPSMSSVSNSSVEDLSSNLDNLHIDKLNFDNLPAEIILNILSDLSIEDLNGVCKQNKRLRSICKEHKLTLIKSLLEKYKVDYKDPHNFIYLKGKKFIPVTDDLQKVFKLYLAHYKKKSIEVADKNITSIPIYPKLKELICIENELTKIESMPLLEVLYCNDNQLTTIGVMPLLTKLECENNRLTEIGVMPLLKELNCAENQLTEIEVMPLL